MCARDRVCACAIAWLQAVEDKTITTVPLMLQLGPKSHLDSNWKRQKLHFNNPPNVMYPDAAATKPDSLLQSRVAWYRPCVARA